MDTILIILYRLNRKESFFFLFSFQRIIFDLKRKFKDIYWKYHMCESNDVARKKLTKRTSVIVPYSIEQFVFGEKTVTQLVVFWKKKDILWLAKFNKLLLSFKKETSKQQVKSGIR